MLAAGRLSLGAKAAYLSMHVAPGGGWDDAFGDIWAIP